MAQMVKNLSAMQEIQVQFLGWEDTLEKGMVTHTSVLARKVSWTESLVGYSLWGHKQTQLRDLLHFHFQVKKVKEKEILYYNALMWNLRR